MSGPDVSQRAARSEPSDFCSEEALGSPPPAPVPTPAALGLREQETSADWLYHPDALLAVRAKVHTRSICLLLTLQLVCQKLIEFVKGKKGYVLGLVFTVNYIFRKTLIND